MNRDHGCDSGDPPDLLARIERGLFGTTDGDLVEDDAQLPVGELRRLLREVVAGCCLCICGHRCRKDPRVIGGDYCVACRWCQCTEHRAASEGTATTPPERRALDLDEVLRRHRNVARAMHENGTPEDVLRGWRAFAGWLRAGMPDEPDVRGSAPTDDTAPPAVPDHSEVDRETADLLGMWEHSPGMVTFLADRYPGLYHTVERLRVAWERRDAATITDAGAAVTDDASTHSVGKSGGHGPDGPEPADLDTLVSWVETALESSAIQVAVAACGWCRLVPTMWARPDCPEHGVDAANRAAGAATAARYSDPEPTATSVPVTTVRARRPVGAPVPSEQEDR